MADEKEEFRIRKIGVTEMIDALTELYNMGVDFVDVTGTNNKTEGQDEICFGYSKSYMDPNYADGFPIEFVEEEDEDYYEDEDEEDDEELPKEEETKQVKVILTDDDIKDLI